MSSYRWVDYSKGDILLNRYHIEEKISETQMSIIYKAFDEVLDMDVCLKFPHNAVAMQGHYIELIKFEFNATIKLNHDNVVKTFEYDDGVPFFIMEFIEGQSLEAILSDKKQLDFEAIYAYSKQVTDALQQAHAEQIVHRDLEPDNVLIGEDGRLKVAGFSFGRVVKDTFTELISDAPSGTPFYMALEQLRGKMKRLDLQATGTHLG